MEYEKCLVQLDEVLNHLSKKDLKKIPDEIREGIKEQKDKEYVWKYNENKQLKEQGLNRKTIAILSYLNTEYLLNDKQKELMRKIHKLNEQTLEKEKMKNYNSDDLFKNKRNNNMQCNNAISSNNALIEVKENKWYKKIFSFLKNFFIK